MFWSPESISPEPLPEARAAADVDEFFGGVGRLDRLDRPPMEMQAWLGELRLRHAEAQFDRNLVGLHGIDRLEHPQRYKRSRDQSEHSWAGAGATRQSTPQPVLAAPDDVFEIGRRALRTAGPLRSLPPRACDCCRRPMGRRRRRSDRSRA